MLYQTFKDDILNVQNTEGGFVMKRLSKNAKIMLVVAAGFCGGSDLYLSVWSPTFFYSFFSGQTINGIDCGGMTVSE